MPPIDPAAPTGPSPKHDAWRSTRVAEDYDRKRFGGGLGGLKHRHDGALLARLLGGPSALGTILDLPTGTGRLVDALARGDRRVTGADRSLQMLRACPGIARVVQADARHLPFRDDAFDGVVCMRFLFHLRNPAERQAVLSEMARVARRLVVVQVRHRANAKQSGRWLRSRVGLSRRWKPAPSRAELEAELCGAGLVLERAQPVSRLWSDKLLLVARPKSTAGGP